MASNFNVDKHNLVPKHSKATEKEKKDLLEEYQIDSSGIPKILKSDAAIKKLNLKPGDMVKIERESPTASTINFFRVVMDG